MENNFIELIYNGVEPLDENEPNGNTIMNFDGYTIDSRNTCGNVYKNRNDLILNINGKKIYFYINDDMLRVGSKDYFDENETVTFEINEKETTSTTLVVDVV